MLLLRKLGLQLLLLRSSNACLFAGFDRSLRMQGVVSIVRTVKIRALVVVFKMYLDVHITVEIFSTFFPFWICLYLLNLLLLFGLF